MQEYQFLPSLSLDEYEALRESIREKGVIEPVVTDENGKVIDGHHRVRVCKELGIEYPMRVIEGLSEEQKQDLSVELNMHRRHLTKEQKKELAVSLREQGWRNARISKVIGVDRSTVGRWFPENVANATSNNSDKSTPTQNLEAIIAERVEQELARRETSKTERWDNVPLPNEEPEPDAETKRLEAEIAARDAFAKRQAQEMKELRQELEAAKKLDRKVIDEMVAAKTAARLAEIDEEERALKKRIDDAHERHNAIGANFEKRRTELEAQVAAKIQEIERAAAVNRDVDELEKERGRLAEELGDLRAQMENEREDAKIREKIRTLQKISCQIPTLIFLLKDKVLRSPSACGLTVEELVDLKGIFVSIDSSAAEAMDALDGKIETLKKRGGLQVVR
jgi:ParB-like chromosome segregation protein Spo0J